jgi:hypothetical protein
MLLKRLTGQGATLPERLTLDTMIPWDLWEGRPRADLARRLVKLAEAGQVELAVTARIREDIPHDPLARKIDQLSQLLIEETGTVARAGLWQIGRDMLGDELFEDFYTQLESERGESDPLLPGWKDWDHLHAHMLQGRDVFLTWDDPILRLATKLFAEFGIRVMRPDEYLDQRQEDTTKS